MITIAINNLKARTILGVYDWEKKEKREVILNLRLTVEVDAALGSDALADTVDYDQLGQRIVALLESSDFNLIERLAAAVGSETLAFDRRIRQVGVEAIKAGAVKQAESVAVILECKRG